MSAIVFNTVIKKGQYSKYDAEIIECMEENGGSFVKALAKCFRLADPHNYQKLKYAFYTYWIEYEEMARSSESH